MYSRMMARLSSYNGVLVIMDCCTYLPPLQPWFVLHPCAVWNHLLLRRFTFMSMCGMNTGNRCPYPPFPFPTITLIRAPALDGPPNRTFVGPLAQPLLKQTSQRLTLLHSLSPSSSNEQYPQQASYPMLIGKTRQKTLDLRYSLLALNLVR